MSVTAQMHGLIDPNHSPWNALHIILMVSCITGFWFVPYSQSWERKQLALCVIISSRVLTHTACVQTKNPQFNK